MKSQYFIFIFLFPQIISLIPNDVEIINFNGNFSENYEITEEKYFQIKITSENLPKYLKIRMDNIIENKNPNFIMTFSKSLDSSAEREQISTGVKSSLMWLTKDQLDKENNLLYITCYSFPCNFTLSLTENDKINMEFNSFATLYITNNNKELEDHYGQLEIKIQKLV